MREHPHPPEPEKNTGRARGDEIGVKPGRHLRAPSVTSRLGVAGVAALTALAVASAAAAVGAGSGAEDRTPQERAAERIVAEALGSEPDWSAVAPMRSILPQGLVSSAPDPVKTRTEIGPALDRDAAPVEGLDAAQMANAITIIEAGMDRGLGERAWAVALATAMQEAKLYNAANPAVPESYEHDWEVEYADHDSVGLFQQRPSMGWGTVEELMDPATSADKFYGTLEDVSGWEDMSIAGAAQAVQVSAFPDYYAQWEDLAWRVIDRAVR